MFHFQANNSCQGKIMRFTCKTALFKTAVSERLYAKQRSMHNVGFQINGIQNSGIPTKGICSVEFRMLSFHSFSVFYLIWEESLTTCSSDLHVYLRFEVKSLL
jgi:hypothetical protein